MGNLVKNGISYTGGSGASSYNELNDKPRINGTTLSGNKTLDDLGIATEINELDDVDISTPSNNDVLKYNSASGKWENGQGGGGGSTYTAGDGIDITEDVISTKKSQEGDIDEIIDVYPQAGSLVSIVNAFNRGDIYSTDEKMIGQWIDGKPLYQKTIVTTTPEAAQSGTAGKYVDIGADIDFGKIVSFEILDVASILPMPYFKNDLSAFVKGYLYNHTYVAHPNTIVINCNSWYEKTCYVTIQYTKTTDSAIAIGDETDYSTSEKIVGTWIDGKPLYQKTIVSTMPSELYDGKYSKAYPIGATIEFGFVTQALFVVGAGIQQLFAINDALSTSKLGKAGVTTNKDATSPNSVYIRMNNADWINVPCYITVQYTKSTT